MISLAKTKTQQQRDRKIKVVLRTRQYLTFIDLKKAFDKVNRHKLIQLVHKMGISPNLTVIINDLLSNTTGTISDQTIHTTAGVP